MTFKGWSGFPITRRGMMTFLAALGGHALLPRSMRAEAAGATVTLEAKPGVAQFLPTGVPTPIWGYGGTVPGPVIRVRQGGEVAAKLINKIGEPTTIHWHGVRLDNAMDGVAHLTQHPVEPDQSFDYCSESNAWYPFLTASRVSRARRSFSRMTSAVLVQTKGFGAAL